MALIGIDLGTTGCRSMVAGEDLKVLGEAYTEYPLIKLSADEIEQDANQWWSYTKKVIRESLNYANINPGDVKGISISAQGISFVPVNKDLMPLRNAISWLDKRAKRQKTQILGILSDEKLFGITGKRISEASVLPKIMWYRENEPELYKKTYKLLTAHDFLIMKLCGKIATDHTMASGTYLYDINKQGWSDELIKSFNIDVRMLPDIKMSGTSLGTLDRKIADELGLNSRTLVSAGGQDQKCAALGAGISEDIVAVSLGTAAAVTKECNRPIIDSLIGIPCHPHVIEGKWVLEGVVSTACASLKWLKETFFNEVDYKQLDILADKYYGKDSCLYFYPHLPGTGTPYANKKMKGFFYGISLSTSKEEVVKSVLEGVAYQIKTNINAIESINGPVKELRIFGGGSKSDIWCRIIADITGKKVVKPYTPETAGVGAAILAGTGAGIYKSPYEAYKFIKCEEKFLPSSNTLKMYNDRYEQYLAIEKTLNNFINNS